MGEFFSELNGSKSENLGKNIISQQNTSYQGQIKKIGEGDKSLTIDKIRKAFLELRH